MATLTHRREVARNWSKNNPDKVKRYSLKTNYNLTPEQFEEMLARQGDRCGICRRPFTEANVPCVDHDHECCSGRKSCGKCIRGLLCQPCNRLLGVMEDNPQRLLMASYWVRTD